MAGHTLTLSEAPITFYIENFFSEGLVRVGLPFFFIISGYFLFLSMRRFDSITSYYKYAVTKRMRSIVLPYLLWSVFWILVYVIIQSIPIVQQYLTRESFIEVPIGRKLEILLLDPIPYQLWYLRHLMLFVLILPVFYYSIKYLGIIVPLVVLLIWMKTWFLWIFGVQDIFFFVLGCYYGIHDKPFPNFKKSTTLILLITWVIGVAIVTYLVLYNPDSLVFQGMKKLLRIYGVLTVWNLFTYIPQKLGNILAKGTVYTFFVYALHEPLLSLVLGVTSRILPYSGAYHLILYFSNFVFGSSLSVLLALFAQRYMNPVFKTLSGGR